MITARIAQFIGDVLQHLGAVTLVIHTVKFQPF